MAGKFSAKERDRIIRDRYPVYGPDKVAEILGLRRSSVVVMASKLGVRYENRWVRPGKEINTNYFKGEITDNMAYVLGYIWADGSVIQNRYEEKPRKLVLGCNVEDKDIVEKVLLELGSNEELKYVPPHISKTGIKSGLSVICVIANISFVEPLVERFGIIPNKSYFDCDFPDYIPEDKWNHFCRGNLDGDGWFGHDKRSPLDTGYNVGWCGNDLFMEGMRNLLVRLLHVKECGIEERKSKTGLLRGIKWQSCQDFLTIGEFLYPEGNGYLYGDRKRNYFERARELILFGD